MIDHTSGQQRSLETRLAALARKLPPERDLWPGIEAAIGPAAARPRRWPYALAAGIAVAALGALLAGRLDREPAPLAATGGARLPAAAPVAARLKATEEAEYRTTRLALEQTYRERLALLAPATRARIEEDLALIHVAQQDIRRALEGDPGSRVLLSLLQSTTEQEFNLYSTVGRNTEPFVSRTRT